MELSLISVIATVVVLAVIPTTLTETSQVTGVPVADANHPNQAPSSDVINGVSSQSPPITGDHLGSETDQETERPKRHLGGMNPYWMGGMYGGGMNPYGSYPYGMGGHGMYENGMYGHGMGGHGMYGNGMYGHGMGGQGMYGNGMYGHGMGGHGMYGNGMAGHGMYGHGMYPGMYGSAASSQSSAGGFGF